MFEICFYIWHLLSKLYTPCFYWVLYFTSLSRTSLKTLNEAQAVQKSLLVHLMIKKICCFVAEFQPLEHRTHTKITCSINNMNVTLLCCETKVMFRSHLLGRGILTFNVYSKCIQCKVSDVWCAAVTIDIAALRAHSPIKLTWIKIFILLLCASNQQIHDFLQH